MNIMSGFRAGLVASASLIGLAGMPAMAQQSAQAENTGVEEIVVTAQRTAQSLQDVPIAVSAFTAEALQRQQINNSSDLQLTLPNITFTKGNFTGSSFTIRGIGDLCVGTTCDSATAIHVNDMPLFGTRLFETEFFDLERVEVLRGPQGTLFGRNATAGVINFVSAKPKFDGIHASGDAEYGNFNSIRLKGMLNVPITDTLGVRVAGFYLNRDGYTTNLYNNTRIDDRDLYSIRGSLRWKPSEDTTVDLMGYYFREKDNRLRIQKQLCQRDPTGVLGCLPGKLANETANANATLASVLTSREFLGNPAILGALAPATGAMALGSVYGPDGYAGNINPTDPRQIYTATTPTYFTDEFQLMGRVEHDFGGINARLSGLYQRNSVDSSQDYNPAIQNTATWGPGLASLNAFAAGAGGAALAQLAPARAALVPAAGTYCTSAPSETNLGVFSGKKVCSTVPVTFDRSVSRNEGYTAEAIVRSEWDGKFNFVLGGIYNRIISTNTDYYVNSFGLDYASAMLGLANTLGAQAASPAFPNSYAGTPFYRNNTNRFTLTSYGFFAEAYVNVTDKLKITAGLRYNHDEKYVSARTTIYQDSIVAQQKAPNGALLYDALGRPVTENASNTVLVPYAATSFSPVNAALLDFDPTRSGLQPFQIDQVSFSRVTGRFVIDYKITDDNLLYFSYSRGYKSGGINPPLSPIFSVPSTFTPESIDSFELGSKNTFLDGTLRLNLTAFYYKYKGLQLSRIVARTSVNDNVDANIYGVEMDAVIQPVRALAINVGASYLHTEVASNKFLGNPRDPSGGRSDVVIIKDVTNASNCAVVPTAGGSAALANGFVAQVNSALGLQAPTAFPAGSGINGATGAFSICSALAGAAATTNANGAGAVPLVVEAAGVAVNIKGNELPQAPRFKASAGVQYTIAMGNGMSIVPRWDIAFTGESYGNIFNGSINRVPSYTVMNAQLQINGKDDKWYARAFIQNLTNNNAITGLYVTDQSSALFTNIFTLEPRRYGVAAGFRF